MKMNHFTIFAHGKNFDADNFTAQSDLVIDYKWKKGDQKRYACKDIYSPYESSGIEIVLGDGLKLSRFEQEKIAIDFIRVNKAALKKLTGTNGVDTAILGIHYIMELDPSVVGFTASFSPQLMSLCLDVRMLPNFYIELIRNDLEDLEAEPSPSL